MDLIHITEIKFWTIIVIQIAGFIAVCLKLYAKSYSTEKGKNLATKEDIGEITEIVESIKTSLLIKTEELKSDLLYEKEHLIHLRASERTAIINYHKATWVLALNFARTELIQYCIDNYSDSNKVKDVSISTYLKDISDSELILNKIKDEVSNLKYQRDISESELIFFYDEPELISTVGKLNLSLSEFERSLDHSINLLLQVFNDALVKVNHGVLVAQVAEEVKRKRSDILANWSESKRHYLSFIHTFTDNLKVILLKRLKDLTS